MHVHLVFVARYRRSVFDQDAIEKLRSSFASVCTDFGVELVEMDGENDHVHLLINYPPKLAVSNLVNSLKGVSSRLLRRDRPDIAARHYYKGVLWTPSYFASSCGGAPISTIRQYIEQQQTPGQAEGRALYPRPEGRGFTVPLIRRKHNRQSTGCLYRKYYGSRGLRRWIFHAVYRTKDREVRSLSLKLASATPIRRHRQIRSAANAYDVEYLDYFKERMQKYPPQQEVAGSGLTGLMGA
jgi:putative transposase